MREADNFEPWTLREIVDYTDNWRATFTTQNGAPVLRWPKDLVNRWGDSLNERERADVIAAVMPHVRARREELIESFRAVHEVPSREAVAAARAEMDAADLLAEAEAVRAAGLAGAFARAREKARDVWAMEAPRYCPVVITPRAVPAQACYICVEGEAEWTPLPVIDEPPEKPKAKPRARPAR